MGYNQYMERVNLLGFPIDTYDMPESIEYIKAKKGHVVTINPEMIDYALKHKEFEKIIKEAELIIVDGVGVQLGLRILGHSVKRIAGIEFAKRMLFELSCKPIALIGAKPYVMEKAVNNLKEEIPNINIVYSQDGYFNDENKVIEETIQKEPELILVAMGSPKQEELIYKLKSKLPNAIMIGVGGSFDVWANEVERAPKFYQKLGLEWLYRTIKEPKRFKRIFPTLPLFVLRVLKEKWS